MFDFRFSSMVIAFAAMVATGVVCDVRGALADHICDPITDPGWNVVATHETIGQVDGTPYQDGATGNWFVDRTVTLLPMCNYYNPIGIYSMRSYSLDPEEHKERIAICRASAQGGSAPVPPYAGACPPK